MRNPQQLIAEILNQYDNLFNRLHTTITAERTFETFKSIADTPAPTLTVRYTRAPIVKSLIETAQKQGLCGQNLRYYQNYLSTGNVALTFGSATRKPIWSMAHMDIISFLTGEPKNGRYPLTPFCEARQTNGIRDALALVYSPETSTMEPIAAGKLHSTDSGHFFETESARLPPATRVVYTGQAEWHRETGMVYGSIDNAFGCAALVLAAQVLSYYSIETLMIFTDEEEGVVGIGNSAFSRGSARLLNRTAPEYMPDFITITDMHEEVQDLAEGRLDTTHFGEGSLFAAFSGGTKGGVTPPQLLAFQCELGQYLQTHNITFRQNAGYVSRSDCISAMLATPNVALIGYPGAYSHFIDTPRAHINDLVNLAKVLVVYTLIAQHSVWREQYLL